ncbi:Pyruvoyl-dependent histidine and arginine decarboxylase [Ascodesmis nigricans]|uniref:arginine decarboxylase n=1 Tax=Ascodesmis nigricans TaxID=341454 RepID=A0A4S2MQN7_9PEZI|nr:Pyruvoyl-dependent histidine and arginine decarboxylase [Ascodesmis nigricans]
MLSFIKTLTANPSPARTPPAGIDITVNTATGTGLTSLSAFDSALLSSGFGNYNLIILSSVIPPNSRLHLHSSTPPTHLSNYHGDRLYCVRAVAWAEKVGEEAWAGIGWVVDKETGKGLFVEHHSMEGEEDLRRLLDASLDGLVERRGERYDERGYVVVGAVCEEEGRPACALAIAVYETRPWSVN